MTSQSSVQPCTRECTHKGPYRVSYRGSINPEDQFAVGPEGAPVDYCFATAPRSARPLLVEADHAANGWPMPTYKALAS